MADMASSVLYREGCTVSGAVSAKDVQGADSDGQFIMRAYAIVCDKVYEAFLFQPYVPKGFHGYQAKDCMYWFLLASYHILNHNL